MTLGGRLITDGWLDDRVTIRPAGGAALEISAVHVVDAAEASPAAEQVSESS